MPVALAPESHSQASTSLLSARILSLLRFARASFARARKLNHPHPADDLRGNRKPYAVETSFGVNVLDLVIRILTPQRVFALGRVAESILSRHFARLAAPYIRHPSNGGNADFVSGMIANKVIA